MRERIWRKIEQIDSKLSYGKPETVGKTTVFRVGDEEHSPHEIILSLGADHVFNALSQFIDSVPKGYVEKGQQVEILVRKDRSSLFDVLGNKLLKRKHNPSTWLIAIRPFSEENYGKPVEESDTIIWEMFKANFRSIQHAPEFHKIFLDPTQT